MLPKFLAKALMKRHSKAPEPGTLHLWEIFRHESYIGASAAEQDVIKLKSSRWRHERETEQSSLELFAEAGLLEALRGKKVLDLGCFTGGRIAYWMECYGFAEAVGIDINPIFEQAGARFAAERGLKIEFCTGVAEELPFESDSLDAIITLDVLEHVRDVSLAMSECYRVLRPGGRLFAMFPQYLQPYESHLGLVTDLPCLHWFFRGKTLARAAYEVLAERGPEAAWYAYESPELREWERLPSLNGISISRFDRIVNENPWELVWENHRPVRMEFAKPGRPIFNLVRKAVLCAVRLPFFRELLRARICVVLEKPIDT